MLTLGKIQLLENHLPRDDKLTLNQSPSTLSIEVEMLTQRHKVLRCLNFFSISSMNVFNFFISNFIWLLCFTCQKALCYISLELPALNLKQDSTMIAHKGAMFFFSLKMSVNLNQYWGTIGLFNASIIMIKFKKRTISRLYYFCNTNQVSKNIYFFLVLLFSVLLYYFRHKNPISHSFVPV